MYAYGRQKTRLWVREDGEFLVNARKRWALPGCGGGFIYLSQFAYFLFFRLHLQLQGF